MERSLGMTGRAAALATRHPWRMLGLWLIVLVGAVFMAGHLVTTDQGSLTVATESERADDLIKEHLEIVDVAREFVLVESVDLTVDDPLFGQTVGDLVTRLRAIETVAGAVSYLDGVPGLVSADGHTALIVTDLVGDPVDAIDNAAPVVELLTSMGPSTSFDFMTIGNGSISAEFNLLAEETLAKGELIGIPAAMVILVFVFGAVVAALVPLLLAVMAIVLAFGLTGLVSSTFDLSFFVVNMLVMVGMAVGIDYSLFIVQRFREERAKGHDVSDAIVRSAQTAARAVVFSGMTVVIAVTGLMYMPDTIMRSLGIGAILAVLTTGLAAVTALPAILQILGDRVNRLRVPFTSRTHYHEGGGRFWQRLTHTVTARPRVWITLAAIVMLAAAAPILTLETGQNFIGSLPEDSPSVRAFNTLNEKFDTGTVTTTIVVTAPDVTSPSVAGAIGELTAQLGTDPLYGDITTAVADGNGLAVLTVVTKLDPSTTEARTAVRTLRNDVLPDAFEGTRAEALVTGGAAGILDYVTVIGSHSPAIFVFVLGLSFVLLTMIFRSIVVPLKAIVMNLLSVGAAYGILVLVFQRGIGADLFGFRQTDVIEAWVPMFLFTVLFGLSMDYHIFLLSRIKENYDRTGDNTGSVAFGLGSTGSIITGAALIMVGVFGGFAAGSLVMFQQMGVGLAVAVVLDATIVRSVLVPAAMALLGDRNWYLPRWLEWIPRIDIEGGTFE